MASAGGKGNVAEVVLPFGVRLSILCQSALLTVEPAAKV